MYIVYKYKLLNVYLSMQSFSPESTVKLYFAPYNYFLNSFRRKQKIRFFICKAVV